MTSTTKQSSGTVGIEVKGNKLRLRLPRAVAIGSQRYISTRLDNTSENFKRLQSLAWQIEADISTGKIAETIPGYYNQFKAIPLVITLNDLVAVPAKAITLSQLWVQYCEYKRSQLAVTTYQRDYLKKYANHIARLPQELNKAVAIRDTLVATTSPDTAKRLLTLLSACGKWAVKSGLIEVNPFAEMATDIKLPKSSHSIDPFSGAERDAILAAFQAHPHHCHYYSFVKFLFLTGCRTGEAIALQWQHISNDFSYITFAESYSSSLKLRKSTKTGVVRRFPINADLRSLLMSIKPTDTKPLDLVFMTPTGLPINNSKFTNQVWKGCKVGKKTYKGILPQLLKDGDLGSYRYPYNARHTFITMMLEKGVTIPQVAKLVGNSPKVILSHYAGNAIAEVPRI
ncbi:tyrosine recombinase XerC [Nostoc sp.]|uniref:site-specific integrase n=1 Tax=Nostoc sp. TaxID=1180 RepID=UPI0035948644